MFKKATHKKITEYMLMPGETGFSGALQSIMVYVGAVFIGMGLATLDSYGSYITLRYLTISLFSITWGLVFFAIAITKNLNRTIEDKWFKMFFAYFYYWNLAGSLGIIIGV